MAGIDCISDQDLQAFVRGELPERLAERVARHLELCPDCEERACRWDNLSDTAVQALRGAGQERTLEKRSGGIQGTNPTVSDTPAERILTISSPDGYTLLDKLGQGATGVVFQARQHHPERMVALKFFVAGAYAAEQRTRFLAEANVIARLDHSNIVRVHAIAEHQGQPFLCLEYLEGGHLGRKIAGRPQPPRQAARLLEQLAQAVQHAHDKGVIHRDLKPANVLLTADGTPKVTDFGLARFGRPELTATGAVLGTPAYMAPEQAQGEGKRVGPVADVWALGVILYELLTGQPPFRGVQVLDTLQQVAEREPVPPRRLQPQVPRDLETICLKCLHKQPPRRYATAAALAEDLQRFLDGRPIQARPVGYLERAAKWAWRRPAAAALLALAVLLLPGSVGGLLWYQQLRLEQAQQQAEREQRTEYLNREVAAALHEVEQQRQALCAQLEDPRQAHLLLSNLDQWQARIKMAHVAWQRAAALAKGGPDLLEPAVTERLQELATQLQADERDFQLAKALDDIRLEAWTPVEGKLAPGKIVPKYASLLAQAGLDVRHGDVKTLARWLRGSAIRFALIAALEHWASYATEQPLQQKLLALARWADPDPWRDQFRDSRTWQSPQKLAELARTVDVSQQSPQTILALAERLPSTGNGGAALVRRALAEYPRDFWLHLDLGRLAASPVEKVGSLRAALAVRPDSATAHYSLGTVLYERKELDGAVLRFRKALQIDSHFAWAHNNLGLALRAQGDLQGAMHCFQKALDCNPQISQAHGNLGNLLRAQKDLDGAIKHYDKALQIDPKNAHAHNGMGLALRAKNDLDGAMRHFARALELDPNLVPVHLNFGLVLLLRHDLEGAIRHYSRAAQLDPKNAKAHVGLAKALLEQGRILEARKEVREALSLLSPSDPLWPIVQKQRQECDQRLGAK
jgi:serine/threonine-protein kinase